MKKEYVTPTMVGERFSADEYVAACVTGTIQCAYPGASPNAQDDGTATFKDNEGKWRGSYGLNGHATTYLDMSKWQTAKS